MKNLIKKFDLKIIRVLSIICILSTSINYVYGQWQKLNFPGKYPYRLFQTSQGLLAATSSTVYNSTDNGDSWNFLSSIEHVGISNVIEVSDILILTTFWVSIWPVDRPAIFRSSDFGLSWYNVLNAYYGTQSVVFLNNTIYIDCDGKIYFSTDTGATWSRLYSDTVFNNIVGYLVGYDNVLYAAVRGNSLYRSDDFGLTWEKINVPFSSEFFSIVPRASELYVGTSKEGFYFSTDKGINWSSANQGLPESVSIKILHLHQNYLIGSIDSNLQKSVYVYDIGAAYWRNFNDGLSINMGDMIWDIKTNDQYVFVVVDSTIWRRPLSDLITNIPQYNEVPSKIILHPNSPNPFNSNTTISFEVKDSRYVTLMIYDHLGRSVSSIFYGYVTPGFYSFKWNAYNQASGIYFVKLMTGSILKSQKMLLLK